MNYTLPPDVQDFVREALARGDYRSETELVSDAVRTLRKLKLQHERLKDDIQAGIDELDRGEGRPLDIEAVKQRAIQRCKDKGIPQ